VVSEVQSTGSHLSPYGRTTSKAQGDALNTIVLHSLDKAIANIDPDSKRIYLALSSVKMGCHPGIPGIGTSRPGGQTARVWAFLRAVVSRV